MLAPRGVSHCWKIFIPTFQCFRREKAVKTSSAAASVVVIIVVVAIVVVVVVGVGVGDVVDVGIVVASVAV